MKSVMITILGIGFLFASTFCLAGEKLEMKDMKDKESYSLGYMFGQSIKAQGLDINLEVYGSGIRDALGGTNPPLSQEEMRKIVSELQQRVMAARQKELKEMGEKNLAAGRAFLEENRLPCYDFPEHAVRVFAHMWRYGKIRKTIKMAG